MKKVIAVLALFSLACTESREESPGPTTPTIVINNCAGNNCQGGSGTDPGSSNSQCSKVQKVEVKILFDGQRSTLAVNEVVTLDATAFDSTTHIDVICPVSWSANGSCTLSGDLTSYNPTLRAGSVGTCIVSSVVGNGAGSRTFVVQ